MMTALVCVVGRDSENTQIVYLEPLLEKALDLLVGDSSDNADALYLDHHVILGCSYRVKNSSTLFAMKDYLVLYGVDGENIYQSTSGLISFVRYLQEFLRDANTSYTKLVIICDHLLSLRLNIILSYFECKNYELITVPSMYEDIHHHVKSVLGEVKDITKTITMLNSKN